MFLNNNGKTGYVYLDMNVHSARVDRTTAKAVAPGTLKNKQTWYFFKCVPLVYNVFWQIHVSFQLTILLSGTILHNFLSFALCYNSCG